MTEDRRYDRDKQKIVGWSWVRKQVFITTHTQNHPGTFNIALERMWEGGDHAKQCNKNRATDLRKVFFIYV